MYHLLACFICLCSVKTVFTQCDNDTNTQFNKKIKDTKADIFDKLLDEYGDVAVQLEALLNKLSSATDRANQNLSDYEMGNKMLKEYNDKLDKNLKEVFDHLQNLEKELHDLSVAILYQSIFNENIDIPSTTMEHLDKVEKKLNSWQDFVEKDNKKSLSDDIMNIPYSVSDDITFLETVLGDEKTDTVCLEEFQRELKALFEKLSTLLNFNSISEEIKQIVDDTYKYRNSTEELFNDTLNILKNESELLEMYIKANDTVKLAEEINALKDEIENLRQKQMGNGTVNLKELNKFLKQLKKFETLEFNIEEVEDEILKYQKETDCYLKFIDDCHIKKASDNLTLPECVLSIK